MYSARRKIATSLPFQRRTRSSEPSSFSSSCLLLPSFNVTLHRIEAPSVSGSRPLSRVCMSQRECLAALMRPTLAEILEVAKTDHPSGQVPLLKNPATVIERQRKDTDMGPSTGERTLSSAMTKPVQIFNAKIRLNRSVGPLAANISDGHSIKGRTIPAVADMQYDDEYQPTTQAIREQPTGQSVVLLVESKASAPF
jgi:hypothetical protein